MKTKEKAKELVDKMQLDWACDSCHNDWAKECALIAVDEILEEHRFDDYDYANRRFKYWQEVKQEIEKL